MSDQEPPDRRRWIPPDEPPPSSPWRLIRSFFALFDILVLSAGGLLILAFGCVATVPALAYPVLALLVVCILMIGWRLLSRR